MYTLKREMLAQIIRLLVEGNSIRSAERITGVHRDTIMRLAVRVGKNCDRIHDATMRGFHSRLIQCDEIWSYVGKKQGRLTDGEKRNPALGDRYIFVGLDAESKLVPTYNVGKRDSANTSQFMGALKERLNGNGRVQLTTDGFSAYEDAVNWHFGRDVDFAQQIKTYAATIAGAGRYSPPRVTGMVSTVISGRPDPAYISTSYVERQNLTMRMCMRRLTRLTNAFSKKLENLKAAVALHFAYYNFARVHQTLRVTPAMEAGLTDHVWTMSDFMEEVR